MTTTAANFTSTALAATVPLFTGPERGAHERVFCAAHSRRPLIVIGGSKELRGMDRRGGGPFGGGV